MIRNNNYYKSSDILKDTYKERMNSFFNPYEYNMERNDNFLVNSDEIASKSKNHEDRKRIKK